MSMQVIVTLSDDVYNWAEQLARLTSRNIADVLADTIELSLPTFNTWSKPIKPVETLRNEELLTLTKVEMKPNQDKRLSILLHRQQAGTLNITEHSELLALTQIYQKTLLRKAQALREAVKRGLREPLSS